MRKVPVLVNNRKNRSQVDLYRTQGSGTAQYSCMAADESCDGGGTHRPRLSVYTVTMKRFLITVVLSSCLASSAWSQLPINRPSPLSQVKQFLGLTDTQVNAILQNNDDYNRFSFQQQDAIRNAQSQIA